MPPRTRIPVYLLTGFLGSGKTTLLGAWLGQPALHGAAVIVNELGEVGLDGALLGVTDQASLVSGACVCCTGLPGLEQALEDLFWARLQRRIPPFPAVAVETTGLADPAPVIRAFDDHPLLRERYRLAPVIAVAGAPGGAAVIDRHPEAQAQVRAAGVLILTKTRDAADDEEQALRARFAELNPHAAVLVSNHADLPFEAVLRAADTGQVQTGETASSGPGASPVAGKPAQHAGHGRGQADQSPHSHDHHHDHDGPHDHHHAAQACFIPLGQPVARDWLLIRLHGLAAALGDDLLRVKGAVVLGDGRRYVVQYAPDARRFDVSPHDPASTAPAQPGLTVIALHADAQRVAAAFDRPAASSG